MRNPFARIGAILAALTLLTAAPAFADGGGDAGPNVAAPPVRAAPQPAPQAAPTPAPAAEPAAITGQSGRLSLMGGELSLNVPDAYRFYPAEAALGYLQRNNAAAPNGTLVGLIASADTDINQPGAVATVLSYDAIGYVPAETASGLSDSAFLSSVQSARSDQNRRFEGFALDPVFEATAANLTWAERTGAPGAQAGGDFRHEARVLGRNGVVGLTTLGSADQQPQIVAALPTMLGMISFPEGRRYADFQPASDSVSVYTVPTLVTGVPPAQPQSIVNQGVDTQTSVGGLAGAFPWIAGGVIVLAAAGYLMMRRRRDPNMDPEEA
ncbi:MAG: DUF2167 domain-containing protein [Hyphomonadaceae bacterium]|nr:DUF2167 domain-containing protein [Hyphomonadaceae bacterium]